MAPTRGEGVKLNVYGRGKTGKTRMACTFPKPMLLIGTEDGTKSVATERREKRKLECGVTLFELLLRGKPTGIDYGRITDSYQLSDLTEILAQGSYASAVLDHAGGFQDLLLKDALGLDAPPVSRFKKAGKGETWGITDRGTWGTIGTQFKERMRTLLDLPDTIGLNIVVIAHERNFQEENSGSDVMLPSVGAALTPTTAGWLNGACDYICQTFIREQEEEGSIEGAGGMKIPTLRKTGKKEYCLRTGPHPIFMTGFRLPEGVELPDVITDPNYDKILKLIKGE